MVDEMTSPNGVLAHLFVRHIQLPVGELLPHGVHDGVRKPGANQVKGHAQKRHCGCLASTTATTPVGRAAQRERSDLHDHQNVEDQRREGSHAKEQKLRHPCPDHQEVTGSDLMSMVAHLVILIVRPNVTVHQTDEQTEERQAEDNDNGAPDRAVPFLGERVAYGDVALHRESQHQKRRKVLHQVRQDAKDRTRGIAVVRGDGPGVSQLVEDVQQQVRRVRDGQRAQVDGRRVVGSSLAVKPDVRGQGVGWESDDVEYGRDHPVDGGGGGLGGVHVQYVQDGGICMSGSGRGARIRSQCAGVVVVAVVHGGGTSITHSG